MHSESYDRETTPEPGTVHFTVGKCDPGDCNDFYILERSYNAYRDIRTVRDCLERHRERLAAQMRALEEVLASPGPEQAERLLLDDAYVRVQEVALRPPSSDERLRAALRALTGSAIFSPPKEVHR